MKKIVLGGVALAGVLTAAIVTAAAVQSSPRHSDSTKPKTTVPQRQHKAKATTTTRPSTATSSTSTTRPAPVDPMAGVAMLGMQGRRIVTIDAQGSELRTIVTAYADRIVTDAQLMRDHQTIWYRTARDYNLPSDQTTYNCSDIVRLNLATNARTVIAHADAFSVAADGNRVVLSGVRGDSTCSSTAWTPGINVVRDVSTGAQSTINGAFERFAISPGGHVLVANHCPDEGDCRIPLWSGLVPGTLGGPVTMAPINDQKLSFLDLVSRNDGLYAIVDKHVQECGCSGRGDRFDRDVSIRRLSWYDLDGAGTELFTVQGPFSVRYIVPSAAGLYAVAGENVNALPALFRLDSGGVHKVRTLPTEGLPSFAPIPPLG